MKVIDFQKVKQVPRYKQEGCEIQKENTCRYRIRKQQTKDAEIENRNKQYSNATRKGVKNQTKNQTN